MSRPTFTSAICSGEKGRNVSIKLPQFRLLNMFVSVAAIASVVGIQMAFWDFVTPSAWSNLRIILGWYLLVTCLATALALTAQYTVRSAFLAVALFGWAFFGFILKFGAVASDQQVPFVESNAWLGMSMMGACLLTAVTVTALLPPDPSPTSPQPSRLEQSP